MSDLTANDAPQIVGSWPECPSWCQSHENYPNSAERYHSAILGEVSFDHEDDIHPKPTLSVTQIDQANPQMEGFHRFAPTFELSLRADKEVASVYFDSPQEARQFVNSLLGHVEQAEVSINA